MTAQFQQTINIYNALGIVGDLAFADGGERAIGATINSSGATPNLFGNYFTQSAYATAEPAGAAPNGAVCQAGGTGPLGGILSNPKANALYGTSTNPLGASLSLPDNTVGQLLQRGYVFVNLPGPANPEDLVTYDPLTGNLNSISPTLGLTASIAPGGSAGVNDVMTVTAITGTGALQVGARITGVGVAGGTFIASLGTGLGGLGTYNLTSINEQTVSSEAMIATSNPPPAFAVSSGYISGTTLTVTTVTSGELAVGQQIFATGILPDTVITAILTGHGGAGTFTVNQSQTLFSSGTPGAFTGPANLLVPNTVVSRYQADTTGGTAVIKLSN